MSSTKNLSIVHDVSKTSFMILPPEIRLKIYCNLLPPVYESIPGPFLCPTELTLPQDFKTLFQLNRTISDEARELFCSRTSFTINIRPKSIQFLNLRKESALPDFPTSPLMSYIKNWQLTIGFKNDQPDRWTGCVHSNDDSCYCCVERYYLEQRVLVTVNELATIENLQSLKVFFPCLCNQVPWNRTNTLHIFKMIIYALEPLNQLRFRSHVNFIAGYFDSMVLRQCRARRCLALTTAFNDMASELKNTSSPPRTLPLHRQWLSIKELLPQDENFCGEVAPFLSYLWDLIKKARQARDPQSKIDAAQSQKEEMAIYYKKGVDDAYAKRAGGLFVAWLTSAGAVLSGAHEHGTSLLMV
ncbi:MAG: hypothetical protein Q9220_005951 [cf. Caloplaca sp. 1 TL-2023]